MIINVLEDAFGVVTTENIPEGRMVLMTSHSFDYNFGSRTDLPGVKMPSTADEAARARFILGFAQTNEEPPLYRPAPYMPFALRQGFDRPDNAPFSTTVYVTNPSVQQGLVIPSGTLAVAYGEGVFTVPSGAFVYSASITTPGAGLTVAYTGADRGKLQYGTSNLVGEVVRFNASEFSLTFRLF